MTFFIWLLIILAATSVLAAFPQTLLSITVVSGAALLGFFLTGISPVAAVIVALIFIAAAVLLNVSAIRKKILTGPLLNYVRAVLPPMSQTERDAIEAGTVWWESELFRGNPDWSKLMSTPPATLTEKEQAFLDGPTNELCAMLDDWEITYEPVSYTHLTLPTNREV